MAKVLEPISDEELKRITVANLRNEYKKLADFYRKIVNEELVYCPHCGQWKRAESAFYGSISSPDGIEHFACRECILNMCTDVDKKTGIRTDNREKTIATFKKLNWYFNEKIYNDQLASLAEGTGEKVRGTAVQQWIVMCRSLNDYKLKSFTDSEFDIENIDQETSPDDVKIIQKTLKKAKKRFGNYSNEDLMFLENEYQDWTTRYPCENKSQELLFKRICFKELEIDKAQRDGKDTKELDATLQNLMGSLNIKPSQKTSNALTDNLTFGQLIDKWEQEKPIPEPEEEFKDVDKIGLYIDVFFKGHLSKMMGLKNAFSSLYERFMAKYTVTKPQYDEDFDSESLFDQIFGSKIDEEE